MNENPQNPEPRDDNTESLPATPINESASEPSESVEAPPQSSPPIWTTPTGNPYQQPSFGTPGAFGSPSGAQGQHGAPGQHGVFGQPGAHGQPGMYGQPGVFGQPGAAPFARRGKRGPIAAAVVGGALVVALAAGGIGGVAGAVIANNAESSNSSQVGTTDGRPISEGTAQAGSVEDAAAKIKNSVVTISAQVAQGEVGGSGVVYSKDGYIVTNNHVVAGASNIKVTFSDGKTAAATVVGTDPSSDLAVIKVDGVSNLTAATFADSDALKVGQSVIAVGAPLGLSNTVTEGIVSALHRPVQTGSSEQQNPYNQQQNTNESAVLDAVQTDAAINPGNSGGPLVDLAGRVVGINTAIATDPTSQSSGNIGVGFSIPSNTVVRVADSLIKTGKAEHGTLGVSASASTGDTAGALVAQVTSGSAAEKAGLKAGDLITKIDDRPIGSVEELIVAVRSNAPGDKVEITYIRDGKESTVSATLTNQSSS